MTSQKNGESGNYIASFTSMALPPEDSGKVQLPSSPRDKSAHRLKTMDRFRKNLLCGSILKGQDKSLGRFRSDREKTRKAEISRDFSAFFAPNFFRISIDPFSMFFATRKIRTTESLPPRGRGTALAVEGACATLSLD